MVEAAESADIDTGKPNGGNGISVGASVRVARLADLRTVRAELGRLYREARRREGRYPDALTAQRLANVLSAVRASIEIEDLERRLKALEVRNGRA